MKRKLISSLLCLCMLFSLLPVAAFAAEGDATGATVAIGDLKFFADGAKANAVVNKEDSERDTMIVPFSGLETQKTYALTLVYPENAKHEMSEDAITPIENGSKEELIGEWEAAKATGAYYFSLNPWVGSNNQEYKGLAAGKYTVKLYTVATTEPKAKEGEETTSTKTYTLVTSKDITLAEVTVDFGTGEVANDLITQHEVKETEKFFTIDENDPSKVKFYVNAADVAKVTNAADTLKTLITPKGDATKFEWTFADNTFTATAPEAPAAGTLSVAPTTETTVFEKNVADIQSNIKAVAGTTDETKNTITVTGESKYVYNWTGFSSVEGQKEGHYIVLDLATSKGGTISYQSPTEENKEKTITTSGTVVLRLENFDTTTLKNQIKLTVKANAEATGTEYILDLSQIAKQSATGLTVAPATETVLDQAVSELQSISVGAMDANNTFAVTGLSQYAEWSKFSTNTAMQKGHYVVLDLGNAFSKQANSGVTITVTGPTGSTPATKVLDDGILAVRLENFEKDNYAVKVSVAAAGKSENYIIDLAGVTRGTEGIKIEMTAGAADSSVPDAAMSNVPAEKKDTVKANVTNIADSVKAEPDALVAANSVALDNAAKAVLTETITEVVVTTYVSVEAKDVVVDNAGTITSVTYDITPMYKVEKKGATSTDKPLASGELTNVKGVSTTVTVDLSSFVSNGETNVYAKHLSEDLKQVIDASLVTTTTATSCTFEAKGFSPYMFAKDTRSVSVTFVPGDGAAMANGATTTATYTPASIGTVLPEATKASATFSGWQIDAKGTTYTTLTDEMLTALVAAAKDGKATLNAVFTSGGGSNGGGGGGGVSSNVTIDRPTNGKVSVSPTAPSKGATVTITLTPDTGYVVGSVTVTDKDGKAVELTKVSDTKYTFTMPDGKVKVAATFTKAGAPTEGFTDVAADAYYADAVKWAVDKGITNGLTATTFGPNNSCTRGQMVTFLWRAAGSPAATGTNSFSDVASGEYYYNAVLWAVEKGITNGTSATTFSPNATVNRGQTVTFLYRYAGSPAATGTSSFTDVAADAFYADAVKWAVAEEITNGTSSTTFSPASNCTRGQIVTFMYRQTAD